VRVKNMPWYRYSPPPLAHQSFPLPQKVHTGPPRMQQTERTDERGRQLIRREWHNTDGKLHRTTGPAVEEWTALPGGGHVLSRQAWYVNGNAHRENRPAIRQWYVTGNGIRALQYEVWKQHGEWHRVGGPSCREWTVGRDGTRTLAGEAWRVNGVQHRVDGPAQTGPHEFWWQDKGVEGEDLPWLRRGRSSLVALAGFTGATPMQRGDGDGDGDGDGGAGGIGVPPAWSRDARVRVVTWHGGGAMPVYRSAVGGSVLLCV